MIRSLNTKGKEFLFAASGFGPNFLMVLMGAYFTDAINPAALGSSGEYQQIAGGVCFILPALFPILYALAKAFDGIIDIPFAHVTDTLSTKWGRRRPAILVCLPIMILSFAMCWWPIGGASGQLLNTIWIIFWSLIFFATYTLAMIAFYGSLSTTCADEPQRLRVSAYKSFFDTISYCFVYALVPLILSAMKMHINVFVYLCLPLMLTLVIPLFLIKEGAKYGYPENEGLSEERVTIKESLYLTFKNKVFMRWILVNCCTFFGLQMFLVSMNTLIIGGMGMNGLEMAMLNTCAFGPVPVMLYLFNKVKAKKGIRFTYQTCLAAFSVAILSFFLGSRFLLGDNNKILQYVIGGVGGIMGSWAIGAFFMMPYHITAQISSVEEKLTHKNHSAMYFAGNAVFTSIVSAISSALIYENIKNLFISRSGGIVWAEAAGEKSAEEVAQGLLNSADVFNFGTMLVPFIVAACCVLGIFLARKMPRDYTPDLVGAELKKLDPSIDLSVLENDPSYRVEEEKGETLFVQIGLSVLSGFLFGFIWAAFLFRSVKEFAGTFKNKLAWVCCALIPFAGVYFTSKAYAAMADSLTAMGEKPVKGKLAMLVSCFIFPILPLNLVALILLQKNANRLYTKSQKGVEVDA